jgi:RNA polymerase sigma-70 factor (ECF subfamily)
MSTQKRQAEIVRLYDEAVPELQRLLYRRLGNREEAEEIAQDAFEKLCLLVERGDIADLRKYFFTMANHLALNVLRRRHLERDYLAQEQRAAMAELGAADDPADAASREEKLKRTQQALRALPQRTLQVFLLHRFEGYTYREIADHLGLSTKAVEYHMSRALMVVMRAAPES